jgi:hypothetical protein
MSNLSTATAPGPRPNWFHCGEEKAQHNAFSKNPGGGPYLIVGGGFDDELSGNGFSVWPGETTSMPHENSHATQAYSVLFLTPLVDNS